MSGTIFLAGILQFQSKSLFEEALEALRTEETYSETLSLVPVFQEAMISDTLMVLRHVSRHGASFYDRLMSEAYLLSEFAGRGYIAGVLLEKHPRVQVAMAAMTHPVIDPYQPEADPEEGRDYLPRLSDSLLTYRYRSEGQEAALAWESRTRKFGRYPYICFPTPDSNDPFNDWWDGHYYLKSGSKWYSVATDLDAQALSDPADEELQLIMDASANPGTTYFTYVPGTENFRLYTHEGFEDVETPAGSFQRAMKVRVDLYFLPTNEEGYATAEADRAFKKVTTTHYFGKGAGLVRLVFEAGDLVLVNREALEEAPTTSPISMPTANPAAPSNPQDAPNKSGKPWWKFW